MRAEGDVPAFLALGPGEWQLPEGTLYGAISSGQPVWPGRHEDSHTLKAHLDYQGGAEAGANGPRAQAPVLQLQPVRTCA